MLELTKLIDKHYISLSPEDRIENLIRAFNKEDTDCIVVLRENLRPIGIITLRDIPKIFTLPNIPKNVGEVLKVLNKRELIVVSEDKDLLEIFQVMQDNNISHLLVVDEEFKLKGVICLKKLIKVFPELFFIDPLTGLQNRFYLNLIETKLKNLRGKAGVIIADLDNFKKINDIYGHGFGDKVLVEVARTLRQNIKITDEAIRYGGEEFLIVLYRCSLDSAKKVGERLRKKIEEIRFEDFPEVKVTASFGIAEFVGSKDLERVIEEADKALYKAKRLGKNRVEVFEEGDTFTGEGLS